MNWKWLNLVTEYLNPDALAGCKDRILTMNPWIQGILVGAVFLLAGGALLELFFGLKMQKYARFVTGLSVGFAVCFVILGILFSPGTLLAKRIVCGLILGCIADVLLNLRYVVGEKGQLVFLLGILVFLSGHILYLAAVAGLSANWPVCLAVGAVLTALLMAWIFRRIFGVFYLGAIMILNCVAAGNLIANPSAFTGLFAAGAVFFLVSDIVLILNTFGSETRQSLRVTNVSLYYVGQLLIALSLRFAA